MRSVTQASVVRPCFGERVSGDATLVIEREGGVFLAIVDALGHGRRAHETACQIVDYLREHTEPAVAEVMLGLDAHVKGSVGAAVGLCYVDLESGGLRYAAVGNTVARRLGSSETTLVSQGGVVGGQMRSPREQTLTIQDGDLLLLHTDGISQRFGLQEYPELLGHDVRIVAGQIVSRFGKDHDDAGCIVARFRV